MVTNIEVLAIRIYIIYSIIACDTKPGTHISFSTIRTKQQTPTSQSLILGNKDITLTDQRLCYCARSMLLSVVPLGTRALSTPALYLSWRNHAVDTQQTTNRNIQPATRTVLSAMRFSIPVRPKSGRTPAAATNSTQQTLSEAQDILMTDDDSSAERVDRLITYLRGQLLQTWAVPNALTAPRNRPIYSDEVADLVAQINITAKLYCSTIH